MKTSPIDYWITLRAQVRPDALWFAYEESGGFRLRPPSGDSATADWMFRPLDPLLLSPLPGPAPQWDATGVFLPAEFDDRVRALLESAPAIRYGPYTTGPLPVAVYIGPPAGLELLDWEQIIQSVLPVDIDHDRVQIVRLARERPRPRPPYQLPIRLLAVGSEAAQALDGLRNSSWYRNSLEVRQFGLQLDEAELSELPEVLRGPAYDIVLVDEQGIEPALRISRRLREPDKSRPRLIVFLDHTANRLYFSSLELPPGMSLLWAPVLPGSEQSSALVRELLLALIHDYPLHEAAKNLYRTLPQTGLTPPLLVADPLSNHDLRIADALDQLRKEAYAVGAQIAPGDIESFLARVAPSAGESLAHYLNAAREHEALIAEARELSHRAEFDFGQESFGLAPMADAEALMALAWNAHDAVASSLEAIAADPVLAQQVEAVQERRVEITMDRLDPNAVYRPFNPDFDALRVSDIYRLNLHVGHRLPNSLLESEPPPLDPLLPELEGESGHQLEVAVYEKDFELLSPRVQTLYLPRLGGSQPLTVECRAPADPGQAELRISIYHKNYLLQSFLMTAQVLPEYTYYGMERQVTVRLDFSRSARFTNLPELGPRLLAIGSNQDANGRTHSFLLKKDDAATQPIRMTEALATEQIGRFRALIEAAATDVTHFAPEPAGPPDEEERRAFEAVIRDLADLGRDLHRFLFDNSPGPMRAQLRQVRDARDQIIQITRHDPTFAFPWPAFYDYRLPTKVSGAPPARVCLGAPLPGEPDPRYAGRGCPHNPGEQVYCVEGFWGIRHRLEQLIEQGDALRDAVSRIERLPGRPGVCLATGVADPPATALANLLQQSLADDLCLLRTQTEFFERLWRPENRPAVCILLSHLELEDKRGEPAGPRMLLAPVAPGAAGTPPEAWLLPGDISDQTFELGEWVEQPRTLMLLMACNGAASDVDTLNNYLTSLTSVGAGAIVGTETSVFSDLVSLFAREVTLGLWLDDATLGETIQRFNRRMITSFNPLAFVFNCFGSADLKLVADGR